MRVFRFNQQVDPPVDGLTNLVCEITDEQIINEYFTYWSNQMILAGKVDEINLENCIQDWITVNYAWEVVRKQ